VHSEHLAIFWHFCGKFRSVCRPLHKHRAEAGTKNELGMFLANSKKGVEENRSSLLKDVVDFFLSFSGFEDSTLSLD